MRDVKFTLGVTRFIDLYDFFNCVKHLTNAWQGVISSEIVRVILTIILKISDSNNYCMLDLIIKSNIQY